MYSIHNIFKAKLGDLGQALATSKVLSLRRGNFRVLNCIGIFSEPLHSQ